MQTIYLVELIHGRTMRVINQKIFKHQEDALTWINKNAKKENETKFEYYGTVTEMKVE